MITILPSLKIDIQEDLYVNSGLTYREIQRRIIEFIENGLLDSGKSKAKFLINYERGIK